MFIVKHKCLQSFSWNLDLTILCRAEFIFMYKMLHYTSAYISVAYSRECLLITGTCFCQFSTSRPSILLDT